MARRSPKYLSGPFTWGGWRLRASAPAPVAGALEFPFGTAPAVTIRMRVDRYLKGSPFLFPSPNDPSNLFRKNSHRRGFAALKTSRRMSTWKAVVGTRSGEAGPRAGSHLQDVDVAAGRRVRRAHVSESLGSIDGSHPRCVRTLAEKSRGTGGTSEAGWLTLARVSTWLGHGEKGFTDQRCGSSRRMEGYPDPGQLLSTGG